MDVLALPILLGPREDSFVNIALNSPCLSLLAFACFQGLVEVVTSSDDNISVRATILLGELLHMVSFLSIFTFCYQKM